MRSNRGLTTLGTVIVVVCVGALLLFFTLYRRHARDEARKARCRGILGSVAKAVNMYLLKYGGNNWYSVPADTFRGDEWLVTLYWTGIIQEPRVFHCPATDHGGPLPPKPPKVWGRAATIPDAPNPAVSYAGLCRGLTGRYAHRNTLDFTEPAIGVASALACDIPGNHAGGIHVVYFDAHVEFKVFEVPRDQKALGSADPPEDWMLYMDPGEP